MSSLEYTPAAGLRAYIDAYWVRKADSPEPAPGRRVYANGCADLILNSGDIVAYFNPMARADAVIPLHPQRLYLGGTMTAYGVVTAEPGCSLTGVRFRPGGFYALYGVSMEPAVDNLVEFADPMLSTLLSMEVGLAERLDTFFGAKTPLARSGFSAILDTVYASGGQLSVDALSGAGHVSKRTMERIFKENVGIPPKEFIRIVRFQEVLKRLRQAGSVNEESLLRVAFDLGYYDHAHLTNEFKKYAGILPSELSHFYKTGITGGQYF